MLGFGWCHIRSSREEYRDAKLEQLESLDMRVNEADKLLWKQYRDWMATIDCPFLQWQFHEELNFDTGLLTYCVARNHRSSPVWAMQDWIAANGPGSYGLFFVHDDEDGIEDNNPRSPPMDYDNVYRVHRILKGRVEELDDPYFGLIEGNIDPIHPYSRAYPREGGDQKGK